MTERKPLSKIGGVSTTFPRKRPPERLSPEERKIMVTLADAQDEIECAAQGLMELHTDEQIEPLQE